MRRIMYDGYYTQRNCNLRREFWNRVVWKVNQISVTQYSLRPIAVYNTKCDHLMPRFICPIRRSSVRCRPAAESDIAAFNFKCGMWMRANEFNPFRSCESSDWCCMRYIWRTPDLTGYKNDRKYTAHICICAMLSLLPLLYSMLMHINTTFSFVSLLYISMNC